MNSKIQIFRKSVTLYYASEGVYRKSLGITVKDEDAKAVKANLEKENLSNFDKYAVNKILIEKKKLDNIIHNYYIEHKEKITSKKLRSIYNNKHNNVYSEKVLDQLELFIQQKRETFIRNGNQLISLKDYNSLKNTIIDYQIDKKIDLSIYELDLEFIKDFVDFMRRKRVSDKNKTFLTKGGLNNKTLGKRLSSFKSFIRFLPIDIQRKLRYTSDEFINLINTNINIKVNSNDIHRLALSKDDIDEFLKIPITNPKEQFTRDWFYIACFTALRYGDIVSLNKSHIVKNGETMIIEKSTNKTNVVVKIMLRAECLEILKKYNYNLYIANHSINKSLKEFFKKSAHFNEPFPKHKKKDGTPYKKYELITTHTGRRTLLTRLLNEMKVSVPKIMAISGHTQQSTLNKYIQVSEDIVDISQL